MIISVLKLEISWSNDGLRQAVIMSGSVVFKTAKLKDRIKKNIQPKETKINFLNTLFILIVLLPYE